MENRPKGLTLIQVLLLKTKIAENGCWEWQHGLSNKYAYFIFNKVKIYAHRASYIIFIGEIEKGMQICHKCDNPKCCNPFHLFKGTARDNLLDCMSKGRRRVAECGKSKTNYWKGCRCDLCKKFYSDLNKRYRAKKKDRLQINKNKN